MNASIFPPHTFNEDQLRIFQTQGGTVLGFSFIQKLSTLHPQITCPKTDVLMPGDSAETTQATLQQFHGTNVFIKRSDATGDYSTTSIRGANLDYKSPLYNVDDNTRFSDLVGHLPPDVQQRTLAYLIQQVNQNHAGIHVGCYSNDREILVEAKNLSGIYLYSADSKTGEIQHRETVCTNKSRRAFEQRVDVQNIVNIQKYIHDQVGFNVNTESIFSNDTCMLVQLRPIPGDVMFEPSLTKDAFIRDKQDMTHTRLVTGEFDVTGTVISSHHANLYHHSTEPLLVVRSDDTLPWTEDYFINRSRQGLETVILDTVCPTVIGHSLTDLPHDPELRKNFKRMGFSMCHPDKLEWHQARLVSNGMHGSYKLT